MRFNLSSMWYISVYFCVLTPVNISPPTYHFSLCMHFWTWPVFLSNFIIFIIYTSGFLLLLHLYFCYICANLTYKPFSKEGILFPVCPYFHVKRICVVYKNKSVIPEFKMVANGLYIVNKISSSSVIVIVLWDKASLWSTDYLNCVDQVDLEHTGIQNSLPLPSLTPCKCWD